jgi:hypothetical protein
MSGNPGYMRVQAGSADPYESGFFSLRHNLGTIKDISEETVNQVSSFLRNQIGDESLAEYLEKESAKDFLGAVTVSIVVVAKEYGQKAAMEYVNFLNNNVAPAISSTSGDWYLKGWELDTDCSCPTRVIPEPAKPGTDLWVSGGGGGSGHITSENDQDLAPGRADEDPRPQTGWTVDVDMDELYAVYKRAGAAEISVPDNNFNNPVGNLLNIQA